MMLLIVTLLNLLIPCRMYAEQLTEQQPNLNENETKLYSDLEVETLIDEISQAAIEAIEQAAGEAAKAAVLASLEREAAALREAARQQADATRWRLEAEIRQETIKATKKAGTKNAVIAGLICLLCGIAVGVSGTLAINK